MNFLKKFNNNVEYNRPMIRVIGIMMVIIVINIFLKIYDKYNYLIGFIISIIPAAIVYILTVVVLAKLYKLFKKT